MSLTMLNIYLLTFLTQWEIVYMAFWACINSLKRNFLRLFARGHSPNWDLLCLLLRLKEAVNQQMTAPFWCAQQMSLDSHGSWGWFLSWTTALHRKCLISVKAGYAKFIILIKFITLRVIKIVSPKLTHNSLIFWENKLRSLAWGSKVTKEIGGLIDRLTTQTGFEIVLSTVFTQNCATPKIRDTTRANSRS